MGYLGQHLVSVVTGHKGGKSGARGLDLKLTPDGSKFGEIKTCSRIDQLGKCGKCGQAVASIEAACSHCGSKQVQRNDDSKWLIGLRNEDELRDVLDPTSYYLVLLDFVDLGNPDTIRATIWTVDPKCRGFAFCMVDYFLNIRAKSSSKAPFNLWPYDFKFAMMKPLMVYQALIKANDTIETVLFPGRNRPLPYGIDLKPHLRSNTLTIESIHIVAERLGAKDILRFSKKAVAAPMLQEYAATQKVSDERLIDEFAKAIYWPLISTNIADLPGKLRAEVKKLV